MSALTASAKRGKWVARRRVFFRWLGWLIWSIVLPVIGLAAVLTVLAGLAFWQYVGHDTAYVEAQQWVQQEFGSFQTDAKTDLKTDVKNNKTSMIPLTDEATPDLQIDRNLTIKTLP